MSLGPVQNVTIETLVAQAAQKFHDGHRFVTMTCLDTGAGHEILYHFDKDYQLSNLRVPVAPGQRVPSISGLCFAALIIENEIQDFFGLSFEGLAVDFKGRLLLTENAPQKPMNKSVGMGLDVRDVSKAPKGGAA